MSRPNIQIGPDGQRIAIFLGAGASVPFGIPATDGILPAILQAIEEPAGFLDDIRPVLLPSTLRDAWGGDAGTVAGGYVTVSARNFLGACLRELLPGLHGESSSQLSLARFNITELLSILDHLLLTRSSLSPNIGPLHLEKLRVLLESAIARTLHVRSPEELAPGAADQLLSFANWILTRAVRPGQSVALVTTNYDVVIESAIYRQIQLPESRWNKHFNVSEKGFRPVLSIDYGQSWRVPYHEDATGEEIVISRPREPLLSILKLHGSLNWLQCPLCHYVYINHMGEIDVVADREHKYLGNSCSCGAWPLQRVLVAPSLVRDIRNVALLSIWDSALEELRRASRWIFVGYSLPPDDVAIRSMLLRALLGRRERPVIDVVERPLGKNESDSRPDPARDELRARYRVLFQAPRFWPIGMEGLIQSLAAPSLEE